MRRCLLVCLVLLPATLLAQHRPDPLAHQLPEEVLEEMPLASGELVERMHSAIRRMPSYEIARALQPRAVEDALQGQAEALSRAWDLETFSYLEWLLDIAEIPMEDLYVALDFEELTLKSGVDVRVPVLRTDEGDFRLSPVDLEGLIFDFVWHVRLIHPLHTELRSVTFSDRPLDDVVADLCQMIDLEHAIDGARASDVRISLSLRGRSVREALLTACRVAGWSMELVDERFRVRNAADRYVTCQDVLQRYVAREYLNLSRPDEHVQSPIDALLLLVRETAEELSLDRPIAIFRLDAARE